MLLVSYAGQPVSDATIGIATAQNENADPCHSENIARPGCEPDGTSVGIGSGPGSDNMIGLARLGLGLASRTADPRQSASRKNPLSNVNPRPVKPMLDPRKSASRENPSSRDRWFQQIGRLSLLQIRGIGYPSRYGRNFMIADRSRRRGPGRYRADSRKPLRRKTMRGHQWLTFALVIGLCLLPGPARFSAQEKQEEGGRQEREEGPAARVGPHDRFRDDRRVVDLARRGA